MNYVKIFSIKILLVFSIIFIFSSNVIHARSPVKPSHFSTPVKQFEGLWEVEKYDFRAFTAPPSNLDEQLNAADEFGGFTIGQQLEFIPSGNAVMPGSINPTTMKSSGPTGQTLHFRVMRPFAPQFCARKAWAFVCATPQQDFQSELMIKEFFNWQKDRDPAFVQLWADLLPIQYALVHLGKSYNFDVIVAKNGKLLLPIVIDGPAKNGRDAGMMGIWLKKVSK
jgi:hypothetical protein